MSMTAEVPVRCTLTEIRLRWRPEAVLNAHDAPNGGLWHPATPFNRAKLGHAAERGNRCFGPETHWLEERQA